jgi:ABC-type Mn2+/Zn2+ transport system ATPase subunit
VIEVFGVGVRRSGSWLLRDARARLDRGTLTLVVSSQRAARLGFIATVTGDIVPDEGRVWVTGIPVMRETAARLRSLVATADLAGAVRDGAGPGTTLEVVARRPSIMADLFPGRRQTYRRAALAALERVGLAAEAARALAALSGRDRARVAIARALVDRPEILLVPELDGNLERDDAGAVLATLARLAGTERLLILVSLADPALPGAVGARRLVVEGDTATAGPGVAWWPSRVTARGA